MPIGGAGFEYQLFLARMSYSRDILWEGHDTAGDPRLFGMHLGFTPLAGWSIGGNALYQYGGGARPSSFTQLLSSLFRRTAIYVAKILTGAKAADLPIEQPAKFELVLNLTTAKALALTIPPGLRGLADKVVQ